MENYKNKEEFDRSIAFTFYAEWAQDADTIEEDYGLEGVGMLCKAIWSYALYEIETDDVKHPPIKYFWNSIKEKIDASQNHRARGFQKEDVELTNKIIDYKNNNLNSSQREIAEVFSCSVGKVNKVLKNYNATSTNTITSTSTTTMNVNVNAHDSQGENKRNLKDLTEEELVGISEKIENGEKYIDVQNQYNLSCRISKETPNECYEIIQKRKDAQKRKQIDDKIGNLYDRLAEYIGRERSNRFDECCIRLVDKCGIDAISRFLDNPGITYKEICDRYDAAPDYAKEYETLEERIKNADYINNLKKSGLSNSVNDISSSPQTY